MSPWVHPRFYGDYIIRSSNYLPFASSWLQPRFLWRISYKKQELLTLRELLTSGPVLWRLSYKKQELRTLREPLCSPPVVLVVSMLLISFVFCIVLLCVFTFWVSSDLCFFAHSSVQHILFYFHRLVYLILAVSLNCPVVIYFGIL